MPEQNVAPKCIPNKNEIYGRFLVAARSEKNDSQTVIERFLDFVDEQPYNDRLLNAGLNVLTELRPDLVPALIDRLWTSPAINEIMKKVFTKK